MQAGRRREVAHAVLDRAALGVGGAVIEPPDTRERDRRRAHGAGLERDVEIALEEALAAQRLRRAADGHHLGVRGRIALGKRAIAGLRDHLAIAHQDAADRHLAGLRRDARLFEREVPQRERTRLFLYHKPRGLLTAHADPGGRPTIFSALPKGLPRLISVGRLDINTEGLLLLTNDGSLARVLELPATGWLRRYRVRAHGRVTPGALERLAVGITISGIRYGPIEATLEHS